jgi:hypothetical protein
MIRLKTWKSVISLIRMVTKRRLLYWRNVTNSAWKVRNHENIWAQQERTERAVRRTLRKARYLNLQGHYYSHAGEAKEVTDGQQGKEGQQMKMRAGLRIRNLLQSGFLEDREGGWRTASITIGHGEIRCKNWRPLKRAKGHVPPTDCNTQAGRQSLSYAITLKVRYLHSYWIS